MKQHLSLKQRFHPNRFLKGETGGKHPFILDHRHIFILPSSRGLGFVLLILLLLLVAIVYNNNLTYILAFLLASIFFISILHSYKALAGIVVHQGKSKNVFAGQLASFEVNIENSGMTTRVSVHIKSPDAEPIKIDILPSSTAPVRLFSKTVNRGRHSLGTITIYSYYPFGLFRAWSPVNFDFSCLVYPAQALENNPYPEHASSSHQQGNHQSGNDDFYGLNEYHSGDSIRRIHWKAYARGHGLFIKQYKGASSAEVWLNYDDVPGNNIEKRLSQLCRWIVEADQAAINYGFKIPGLSLQPSRGDLHFSRCLETLALFGK